MVERLNSIGRRRQSGRQSERQSERGSSLIEATLASALLMLMLVPLSGLLISSTTLSVVNRNQLTAEIIAGATITAEQQVALQSTTGPQEACNSGYGGTPSLPVYVAAGFQNIACTDKSSGTTVATALSWPSGCTVCGTVKQSGTTFTVEMEGGWCALTGTSATTGPSGWASGTPYSGASGSVTPMTFFVAVQVRTANLGPSAYARAVQFGPLPSQPAWFAVAGGVPPQDKSTDAYQCPMGTNGDATGGTVTGLS